MKAKYSVYRENGFDAQKNGYSRKLFRTFKNERDAMSFYNDPKNSRAYGTLFLEMTNNAGKFDWDDSSHRWVKRQESATEAHM